MAAATDAARRPVSSASAVGFVALGGARKVTNLRALPQATVVVGAGFDWVAVEGVVDSSGRTTSNPTSTARASACCSETSSAPRAVRTTTGRPSTG
jgi:hypothetical protein